MMYGQQSDRRRTPAEQLRQNINFRISSAREMVQNLLVGEGPDTEQGISTPLERRAKIFRKRREALTGLSSTPDAGTEAEEFPDLPENVVIATDDVRPEQVAVAKENAHRFNRIVLKNGGKVDGLGHGRGGSVTLREFQDQEFTIDREITAEEPEPYPNQSFTQVRSMSEAAENKV